jgi:UDP-3-O-[3-hydroxymyristoyl] N-acetylglucosamine deacetylase
MTNQKTLRATAHFSGVGLHSGRQVKMTVMPAAPGEGICFVRAGQTVRAQHDRVDHTPLCTLLRGDEGLSISTVEHFMAAAWALGLSNLKVLLDADELPILDGSSAPFIEKMSIAGICDQGVKVAAWHVKKSLTVYDGEAWARLLPDDNFSAAVQIDFPIAAIGKQKLEFTGSHMAFSNEIARARTFCMSKDVIAMQKAGRALGGSYDNAVVFDGEGVLNPMGMRMENEPVRHKMLDAIGDLYLAGGPIVGRFEANRPGHKLTNLLLREAFNQGCLVRHQERAVLANRTLSRELAA